MQDILDVFKDRVHEIDLYFQAIKNLDQEATNRTRKSSYFNSEFIKILKANTLLMIYNLVESTVIGGILVIYDKLRQEGLTYFDVRQEIKDIWFSYKFRQAYHPNAHFDSLKGKAKEIVNSILTQEVIDLDRKATVISGNIDAQQIRNVCNQHGIVFKSDAATSGGAILETVKNHRNNLAHGTVSFAECGRDYSIDDLDKIKKDAVLYLEKLLNDMKQYTDKKQYKNG